MANENEHEQDSGRGLALETAKPEVARPPLFQVLLLNDDFTPMDFVVEVLRSFFTFNQEQAVQIMLHVHTRGRGVCGVFTREVAKPRSPTSTNFTLASTPVVVHYGKALNTPISCLSRR
ncbi:ATP-dependent Clp protease adapter protein ClpS [Rhodanobacter lindaniclasticus]